MNIGQSQSLLSLLQKEITSDLVEKTPKKKIKIDPLVVIEEIFDNQEDLATADPLDEISLTIRKILSFFEQINLIFECFRFSIKKTEKSIP